MGLDRSASIHRSWSDHTPFGPEVWFEEMSDAPESRCPANYSNAVSDQCPHKGQPRTWEP